jgi:hypothetical protein
MADFVQNSTVKSAVRVLAEPFADIDAFNAIVESVITGNPFACVAYMTGGITHQPVEKTRESYVVKIVYEDIDAKSVGTDTGKYNSVAGFNAGAAAMLANTDNTAAHGGTPARDFAAETYSASIRCHDPNGELYYVTLSREQVSLTSYSDDSIRTKVETWADTVPALA